MSRHVHNHDVDPSCTERLVGACMVTIDPEDDATVDRVADAIRDHHGGRNNEGVYVGINWVSVQDALRSMLTEGVQ